MAVTRWILLGFVLVNFEVCVTKAGPDHADELLHRYKRQLGGGGDACLHIFSVPKRSVTCEPSQEVRNSLEEIRDLIGQQKEAIDTVNVRVDTMDPDKPRELPQEVKDRLETIDNARESIAAQREIMNRLESEINRAFERLERIENSEKEELAQLIERQTHLIQLSLHQSNVTIHEEYLDKLASNTKDLTDKLQQMETDLKDVVAQSEDSLKAEVTRSEDDSRLIVTNFREMLSSDIEAVHRQLNIEILESKINQNHTKANENKISSLHEAVAFLENDNTLHGETERVLRGDILILQDQLTMANNQSEVLTKELSTLKQNQDQIKTKHEVYEKNVAFCHDKTTFLEEELKSIMDAFREQQTIKIRQLKVPDCQAALQFYHAIPGIYSINPFPRGEPFDVYCDMREGDDEGSETGWTVIQRRINGSIDFYRGWEEYKMGFGDANGEYWLGLEKLHLMTNKIKYMLRVDMLDFENEHWFAEYDSMLIDSEEEKYTLHVGEYNGNAGDSLSYHSGVGFSTMDRNNDINEGICAQWCHGAWWYRDCYHANLNGLYYDTGNYVSKSGWGDGIVWRHIKDTNYYSMKSVSMKIKPVA